MTTNVVIQPLKANGYEAYIDEVNPDTNYKNPDPIPISFLSGDRADALIQFWLTAIPANSFITQAKFGFYVSGGAAGSLLRIYRIVEAWYNDTVTWNTRPINGVPPITVDVVAGVHYEIDVTAIAQYWLANPDFNLGFYLSTKLCQDCQVTVRGSAFNSVTFSPYLKITYEPGNTPTALDPHANTHVTGGGDTIDDVVAAGNSGLMSGADKTKLNGIEAAAKNYPHAGEQAFTDGQASKLAGIEAAADVTDAGNIATAIADTTETTPLNADEFPFWKASGTALKKVLWSTIKSTLKTYNDTLYYITGGALGKPASGDLSNCTGLPLAGMANLSAPLKVIGRTTAGAGLPEEVAMVAAEASSSPAATNAEYAMGTNIKYYHFFTLPTDYPFYIITQIQWQNGTVVNGNVMSGVDWINANPPSSNPVVNVALGVETAQAGADQSYQTSPRIISHKIPGGAILGAWIMSSSASGKFRYSTQGSQNQYKTYTYTTTMPLGDSIAFAATTARYWVKPYYKGCL